MNKRVPVGVTVSLMIIVAALTVCITMLISQQIFSVNISSATQQKAMFDKIYEIDQKVRDEYYGEIDQSMILDGLAEGYVAALGDDYAAYSSAKTNKENQQSHKGRSAGIGITATAHPVNGSIYVYLVDKNGPAEKAGIKKGDEIIKIADADVRSLSYTEAMALITDEAVTDCSFVILREGQEIPLNVTKADHEHTSVYYHMVGTIGYIQLTGFDQATVGQFKAAVEDLKGEGVTSLVFDVRNNGGGLVDSAAEILDYLLPEGDIISATYADGSTEVLHKSDSSQIELPMAVIVDGRTASAAELFAAAIRDYNKGKLIGVKTYGKGVMQRTYSLSDGSAVKFTIAEFNSPSGKNFDKIGITPDILVELTEEQSKNYYLLDDTTDPQILAAFESLSGTVE